MPAAQQEGQNFDVIILDPPRAGSTPTFLKATAQLKSSEENRVREAAAICDTSQRSQRFFSTALGLPLSAFA